MSLGVIDVIFLTLAYYALRMTTIKNASFVSVVIWMLRVSAVLMVVSVAINDNQNIADLKQVPIIGMVGFVLYGLALGVGSLKSSPLIGDSKNSLKGETAYTWDMVVVGVLAILWIIVLLAQR